MSAAHTRDIVVIGSSLGGIEALTTVAAALPADLPASLFVVQHSAQSSPGFLPRILDRAGPLPAVMAQDGMPLERGRIVVAPPGRHMLLTRHGVRLVFGPRENRSRPAVDPLFRTAAVHLGSRVVGVVLTGAQSDGAAGLSAIERCGGHPIVQAPSRAAAPGMPESALAAVPGADVVPLEELAALLDRVVRQEAPPSPPVPDVLRLEARLTERATQVSEWERLPGEPTDFTCPDCSGSIRRVDDDGARRYRCRVGHAFTPASLMEGKDQALEDALWVALQTLQERAQMLEAMARDDRSRGWSPSADQLLARAAETRTHAERVREALASLVEGPPEESGAL